MHGFTGWCGRLQYPTHMGGICILPCITHIAGVMNALAGIVLAFCPLNMTKFLRGALEVCTEP